jgi:hypothetical protein
VNLVTDKETGFFAGKHPLYLTVYNKAHEQLGKTDRLYLQALVDRRWFGQLMWTATRVEYQLCRRWLREHGIDSPEDFLERRGKLAEKLTHDFFRITEDYVDLRGKHQGRAETHPLWVGIQKGFETVFGPPQGELVPLDRQKVQPVELVRQGRGCIANGLLQMGVEFKTYPEFLRAANSVLDRLFSVDERHLFLATIAERQMEYVAT